MAQAIITLEDGVEVLETTGDLDAFAYGGGVVYKIPPHGDIFWQFWEEREPGQKNYHIYSSPVPIRIISEFPGLDIKELCLVGEITKKEITKLSLSKDPKERITLLQIIREANGPSFLDPDGPEILSPWDLAARWGVVFGQEKDALPKIDYDDFLIRSRTNGYEAGLVSGKYLGRHEDYESALSAISYYMKKSGLSESNLFYEHEPYKIELIIWDPEKYDYRVDKTKIRPSPYWRKEVKKYQKDLDKLSRGKAHNKSIMKTRKRKNDKMKQELRRERAREVREAIEKYLGG